MIKRNKGEARLFFKCSPHFGRATSTGSHESIPLPKNMKYIKHLTTCMIILSNMYRANEIRANEIRVNEVFVSLLLFPFFVDSYLLTGNPA